LMMESHKMALPFDGSDLFLLMVAFLFWNPDWNMVEI